MAETHIIHKAKDKEKHLELTITNKNQGWQNVSKVDFGGANVTFNDIESEENYYHFNEALTEVTNGTIMNDNCHALFTRDVNLQTFNCLLPNITNGETTFGLCDKLSSFTPTQMPKLVNGYAMFQGCESLTEFNCDIHNIANGESMFDGCYALNKIKYQTFDKLTNANLMFCNCSAMTDFNCDISKVDNGYGMFFNCTSLSSFTSQLPNLISGGSMFLGTQIKEWSIDLPDIVDTVYMFQDCSALTSFTSSMPKVTDISTMFWFCPELLQFTADMRSIADMEGQPVFRYCSKLETFSANCSGLVKNYSLMFFNCTALTDVQIIVPNALSATTNSDLGISSCPATAYTYVDIIDDNCVRLTFTATERIIAED